MMMPRLMVCSCAALLAACAPTKPISNESPVLAPRSVDPSAAEIAGSSIVVLCDADTLTSTMFDGLLSTSAAKDALTVLPLPIAESPDRSRPWKTRIGQSPVSNSVFGPPTTLAVSPDGKFAFVSSSWGQRREGVTTLEGLAREKSVTAIDLTDGSRPVIVAHIDLPGPPNSVDVSPQGDLVAVAVNAKGQEVAILDKAAIRGGAEPLTWPLVGLEGMETDVGSIAWHPTGRYLAVTLPKKNMVVFFEFARRRDDGRPGLAPWGSPVKTAGYPLSGRFTPDGRAYAVACTNWKLTADVNVKQPAGQVQLIRLSAVPTAVTKSSTGMPVEHTIVASLDTGVSPESLVIAPDGATVAVGCWEGSVFPDGTANFEPRGSVMTFTYAPSACTLTPAASATVPGMPGGLAFDANGKHLVVSLFRGFDAAAATGELAVYRVGHGAILTELPYRIGVGAGPHGVVVTR